MRVVVIVVAALMTLGLAAFGIVAAQKGRTRRLHSRRPSRPAPAMPRMKRTRAPVRLTASRSHRRSSPHRSCPANPPRRRRASRRTRADATAAPADPVTRKAQPRGQHRGLRQARRHGPLAHRRDRHHRRARLRLRALQAIRFPARPRSRAHLRRRPVAGEHAGGAQGARRQLPQGDVLRDRRARDVASGNRQAGRRRRQ